MASIVAVMVFIYFAWYPWGPETYGALTMQI